MASYRPQNAKPWMARRKRDEIEYVIGWFETKTEAEEAERGFDSAWISGRGSNKGKRRYVSAGGRFYFA